MVNRGHRKAFGSGRGTNTRIKEEAHKDSISSSIFNRDKSSTKKGKEGKESLIGRKRGAPISVVG